MSRYINSHKLTPGSMARASLVARMLVIAFVLNEDAMILAADTVSNHSFETSSSGFRHNSVPVRGAGDNAGGGS